MTSALVLIAAVTTAHDTWIMPMASEVQPGGLLALNMTSGMSFPALDHAIAPDRLQAAQLRVGTKSYEILERVAGKSALELRIHPPTAGLGTVWVESRPKFIELKPEQVKEYLEEIGAGATIGKEWNAKGPGRQWRENFTKHAKTFVRVGEPIDDRSWAEPVGMALELTPEADPTALRIGDVLTVRLLENGRPLPDFPVGLVAAAAKNGSLQKTDAHGRVSFRLDRDGWWLLRATHVERSAKPGLDWESHFTTLTFRTGRKK
jgi:uncharacterized GH25 family protein